MGFLVGELGCILTFIISYGSLVVYQQQGRNHCWKSLFGATMKCFHFSNEKNQNETKSMPVQSSASMSTDHDVRRIESGFDSQNVSDMSIESSSRTPVRSPSQKPNNLRVFCLSELKAATRNFSNLLMIGEGGFGCVYRGRITSTDDPRTKIDVAIKQLGTRGLQGHKEWVTEVNVLGVVEHPNLVKLVGYCAQDDERGLQRSLIYEYMRNRSVEDHLSLSSTRPLSWSMRLKIAMDSACGLAYLHEQMDFQIIFRDFKSSNILLDDQWNAKLSDFGLAREGPSEGYSHVSTAIVGTLGYAAPEYIQTGRLTSKSDVWSYGVFLYELITGRRPIDRNRPRSEQNLLEWVKPHLTDMKKFELILDPRLEGKYDLNTAMKLAAVANRCLLRQQRARPKMSEVLEKVKFILEGKESENPLPPVNILDPKNPFDDPVRKESNSKRSLLVSKIADCLSILRAWSPKLIRIS